MSSQTINNEVKVGGSFSITRILPADVQQPMRTPITRGPYVRLAKKKKTLRSMNKRLASSEFSLVAKAEANTQRLTGLKRF